MAKTREFPISELFDIAYGNGKLTKAYIHGHPGPYPVFGASANPAKIAGLIDTFDFNDDGLSFVRIGYAGHVALRKAPFSVTCNVLMLLPKSEHKNRLHLRYLVPVVSAALRMVATGRFKEDGRQDYTQINQKMALNATIEVPVDDEGRIDLAEQVRLAEQYQQLSSIKSNLAETAERLATLRFALALGKAPYKELPLSKVFTIVRGNSDYTEKFARSRRGEYPLYTAATRDIAPALVEVFDHDIEALHYTTEGAHAGTVFHRPKHKFALSGHAGILVKKMPEISYAYALYEVARVFGEQGFRWASNTPSKGKISELMLRFPVDEIGDIDAEAQEAIARRMIQLLARRDEAVDDLRRLADAEVIFAAA